MTEITPNVARELYPIAPRQARRDLVENGLAAAFVLTGATLMWLSAFDGALCLTVAFAGGGPTAVRVVNRWRQLRRMSPTEAAASGLL
jgi:hypothetical protein